MSKITKYSRITNCNFTVRFTQAFDKLGLITVNQAGLFLDRCHPDCRIDTTRAAILRTELHKFYENHGLY